MAINYTPRLFGSVEDHGDCPEVCELSLGLASQMAGSCPRKRHDSDGRGALSKNLRCISNETNTVAMVFSICNSFKRLGSSVICSRIRSQYGTKGMISICTYIQRS